MALTCHQTHALYKALDHLNLIAAEGLPTTCKSLWVVDEGESTVVQGERRHVPSGLIETEGEEVWAVLERLKPGLLRAAPLKEQQEARTKLVNAFGELTTTGRKTVLRNGVVALKVPAKCAFAV